jgi:hypothetical protein
MSRSFGGFGFRSGLLFPCLADRPRGARGLSACSSSSRCSSCSWSALVLIRLASCFLPEGIWRTVRSVVADYPRDTSCSRTVRGRCTDCPLVEVLVGSFCSCLTDNPSWVADRPHGDRGSSAPGPRTVRQGSCRTAKSFASCFVLPLWNRLGFVPRVRRSVVTT